MKGDISVSNLLNLTSAFIRRVNYALIGVANFIIAALALGVTVDVVMRYIFNSPLTGVKQIGEYAMVWLCFLSVGWVLICGQHVSITLLETWLLGRTKRSKKRLYLFIDIICLFYSIPLLCLSGKEVWIEYWEGTVLTGELGGVVAYLPHFCIPIGFLSISIILILRIVTSILGIELPTSASEGYREE